MKAKWFGLSLTSTLMVLRLVATMPQYPDNGPAETTIDWMPLVTLLAPVVLGAVKKLGFLRSLDKDGSSSMSNADFVAFADGDGDGKLSLAELIAKMEESGAELPHTAEKLYAPFMDTVLNEDDVSLLLREMHKTNKT